MSPDDAKGPFQCPSCGALVQCGELLRAGHQLLCCFEAASAPEGGSAGFAGDVASGAEGPARPRAYLRLPSHPGRFAPRFIASVFGDYAMHGCFVSLTMPSWRSGIGPEPRVLPS